MLASPSFHRIDYPGENLVSTVTVAEWAPIGTVAAAVITLVANSALDRRSKIVTRRAEAYIDFLTGLSRSANLKDRASKGDSDISILEAKHRIILYGSRKVVAELARLHDVDPRFAETEAGRRQYSVFLNAMRADCSRGKVSEYEIVRLLMALLGQDMPEGHPRPPSLDKQHVKEQNRSIPEA